MINFLEADYVAHSESELENQIRSDSLFDSLTGIFDCQRTKNASSGFHPENRGSMHSTSHMCDRSFAGVMLVSRCAS